MDSGLKSKLNEAKGTSHRLLPSYRLLVAIFVGVGSGLIMMTRFNVTIGVLCMVDGPSGPTAKEPAPLESRRTGLGTLRRENISDEHSSEDLETIQKNRRPLHEGNANVSWLTDFLTNTTSVTGAGAATEESKTGSGGGEFDWDRNQQGLLLSSFFYGYTVALSLGGWLSDRFPANYVLLFGVSSQGVASVLAPLAARFDLRLLLALRALQGVFCAGVLPACTVLLRNWCVPSEYSTMFALAWGTSYMLSGLGFPTYGFLCSYTGWTGVFYVVGALPLIWTAVGWFLLTLSPEDSSFCSQTESRFIISQHLHPVPSGKSKSEQQSPKPKAPPILAIVTNPQMLIICLSFFVQSWVYYSVSGMLPTFLKDTAGVDINQNGLMSGMTIMCMTFGVVFGGSFFDYLLTKRGLSRTTVRKLITAVSSLIPAALLGCIILLPPNNLYLTISLLCVSNLLGALFISGGPLSAGPEIAPQYTGIIWGIAGSIGNSTGFLAPLVATSMTPNGSIAEWRSFFLISIVSLVVLTLVVVCFWRSEVQPFALKSGVEKLVERKQKATQQV